VAVDERSNSLAVWSTAGGVAVQAAFRPRTGDWSARTQLSLPGENVFSPRIAIDGDNNAIAVWAGEGGRIHTARRPDNGTFGSPSALSAASGTAFDPDIVFDNGGNALVAWARTVDGVARIETSSRPRGGSFDNPQAVSRAGEDAFEPRLAVDDSAAVVWSEHVGESLRVQGAFRPKDGQFGGPQTLSEPGDNSFGPDLAMDNGGDVLAAWTRVEFSGFSLVQFSSRPRVGSFGESSALSAPQTGSFEPQVATDRLGNSIAVWTVDSDLASDSNPTYVEAAYAPAGGRFETPLVLSDAANVAYQPHIAFESDGDATVVWTEEDSGKLRVKARFRPAGNGWIPAAPLSAAGDDAFDPQVAAGRGTVVVWSETDGTDATVKAAAKPEDASFLPPQTISRDAEEAHAPQVAVAKDGTAVAAWYAGFGDLVAGAVGHASAAGFEPATTLSPDGMAASEPQVAIDEQGDAIAVWTGGDTAFIQAAYRPRRGSFGEAETVTDGPGVFEPQVAFDESGNVLSAWTRAADTGGQIETAFRPRGGTFDEPLVISDTGAALDNFEPRIAADDSAAVVWTASRPGGLQVQSSFRPKDGVFGPVQTLSDTLLFAFETHLAVDERGNVRAIWTQTDTVDPNLPPAPSTIQTADRPRA
jgi:hypothetical protein